MTKKSILIINTGGTISSAKSPEGFKPQHDIIAKALAEMPELKHEALPDYELIELSPLLDSANVSIDTWNELADIIEKHYPRFHGFVILHGTDTLAYTASALSFVLENINKPVIITGSQIPLCEFRNDAKDNLITSLWLAASPLLNEVAVYFDQHLLRGNRTQKVSAYRFSAFKSPNYPALATVGTQVQWQKHLLLDKSKDKFIKHHIKPNDIANFRLFPGCATKVLAHILEQPLKGLILETYGMGNAPTVDTNFIDIMTKAIDKGLIIVNCSQCQQGYVEMETYATGMILKQAGLLSGYDMTAECAHTKLLYLLSLNQSLDQVKEKMLTNLRGELSSH